MEWVLKDYGQSETVPTGVLLQFLQRELAVRACCALKLQQTVRQKWQLSAKLAATCAALEQRCTANAKYPACQYNPARQPVFSPVSSSSLPLPLSKSRSQPALQPSPATNNTCAPATPPDTEKPPPAATTPSIPHSLCISRVQMLGNPALPSAVPKRITSARYMWQAAEQKEHFQSSAAWPAQGTAFTLAAPTQPFQVLQLAPASPVGTLKLTSGVKRCSTYAAWPIPALWSSVTFHPYSSQSALSGAAACPCLS